MHRRRREILVTFDCANDLDDNHDHDENAPGHGRDDVGGSGDISAS